MAVVEYLNYGCLPGSPGTTPGILGRSTGIDQILADEIVRLCKGWGQPSSLKESLPALLSFPLKARSNFAAKGAYAVIRVHGISDLIFQIAVLSRSDYSTFGFNPFALIEAGVFPAWDPAAVVSRRTIKPVAGPLPLSPPPSPDDVGLVDEALHQLLASHKLYLPIEEPSADSDRCLALLIEVIPVALKQQLRFASFAPSSANGYHLAATATDGCNYSGWQRLMMTLVGGALPDNLDNYVKKVRDCLAFGDLSVIREQSRLVSLSREKPEFSPPPKPRPPTQVVTPVIASVTPTRKKVRPKRTMTRPAAGREGASSNLGRLRGSRRQLPGFVIGLLVLAVTLGGGWSYLEFFHSGGGIKWDELISWPGQGEETNSPRVASLLEVPNVGAVYQRQIKKIHRAGMIPGLNKETDQRRGLANLKVEAALPLLEQVDLFLELSAAGIRQGSRPDREAVRLKALAHQGKVLEVELARLELAWHSLSSGVNWEDLNNLSDKRVVARRDSLHKVHPKALKAAALDMNFESRLKKLGFATGQVGGMSQLLVLFQASQWSEKWSRDLYRAAEMVSPSASIMTRAYRNSAFTLVRLKKAEHQEAFRTGAFAKELKKGVWPGENVADILPDLRREVGKFSANEAPPLLAGTLQLYQVLDNPMPTVAELVAGKNSLKLLNENPAVLFDPEVYENYLERLRYQAGLKNPALYPVHEQAQLDSPFLKKWAKHEKLMAQQSLLSHLSQFDETFSQAREQVKKLRDTAEKGRDWTAVWVDLDQLLDKGLEEGSTLLNQDHSVATRMEQMHTWRARMGTQRSLKLNLVTVRMDQNYLDESEKVVFEFQVMPEGKIYRSESFTVGPAAPEGSGWVGTVAFKAAVPLSPEDEFRGTIRSVASGSELVKVEYPSLSDRVGPGALARPRSGQGGKLLIKTEDSWWRGLHLPEMKKSPPTS